jgi:hypothetical protein
MMANRTITISRASDGKALANRRAPSLKQALQDYYKETLSKAGWTNPVYSGNTLSVEAIKVGGIPHATYIATEAK